MAMSKKLYNLMDWAEIEAVTYSEEDHPKGVLGAHPVRGGQTLVTAYRPDAKKIELKFVLVMLSILLASCLFIYLKGIVGKYATERMAHTLRMDFADNLLVKSTAETMGGCEAMSKAQNELTASSEGLSGAFDVIEQFLSGILALFFLLFENLRFTLIVLGPMDLIKQDREKPSGAGKRGNGQKDK